MKHIVATVSDEFGVPLPGIVQTPVVIQEEVGKASVYEIPIRMEQIASADPRWFKGSTITLSVGDIPANTNRRLVIEGRKRRYEPGGQFIMDLSCKCTAGRMRRTRQDAVWTNMTPAAILQAIALRYGLAVDTDSPDAVTTLVTVRQLSDDWDIVREIGRALNADVYIIGQTLFVKDRSAALMKIPVRRYAYPMHPFQFTAEESVDGRAHAKAANDEGITVDRLTGQVVIDGLVVIQPELGTQSLFNEGDPGGIVKTSISGGAKAPEAIAWQAAGAQGAAQSIPGIGWVADLGQYDAGKGTPKMDWTAVFTNNTKSAKRRGEYRDRTSKATLSYIEWDPRGVPMLGTKIEVVMDDPVSSGVYYVLARTITLRPDKQVELTVTRHATNYTGAKAVGKTLSATIVSLVQAKNAEIDGGIEKTPQSPSGFAKFIPSWLMDFGG